MENRATQLINTGSWVSRFIITARAVDSPKARIQNTLCKDFHAFKPLIVEKNCVVGKVSWYISYLTVIEFPLKRRNKNRRFPPNQHHNLTFSGFKTKSSGGNNLQSSWKFFIMNIAAFLLPPHPGFPFSVYSNCDDLPFALMIPEGSSERSDITLTCIPPNWVISPSSWWRNPQITCQSLRKLIFYSSLRMSEHEH